MKLPPGMVVRTWEKRGETRYAFYHRSSRATGRKMTPLGTDYQLALKANKKETAYVVSNGRPVYEWVEKGSARDRMAKFRRHQ